MDSTSCRRKSDSRSFIHERVPEMYRTTTCIADDIPSGSGSRWKVYDEARFSGSVASISIGSSSPARRRRILLRRFDFREFRFARVFRTLARITIVSVVFLGLALELTCTPSVRDVGDTNVVVVIVIVIVVIVLLLFLLVVVIVIVVTDFCKSQIVIVIVIVIVILVGIAGRCLLLSNSNVVDDCRSGYQL